MGFIGASTCFAIATPANGDRTNKGHTRRKLTLLTPIPPRGKEGINCKTELADDFPIQVVCDWIGNTEAVASKYYLPVTEDHFIKALQNALQ